MLTTRTKPFSAGSKNFQEVTEIQYTPLELQPEKAVTRGMTKGRKQNKNDPDWKEYTHPIGLLLNSRKGRRAIAAHLSLQN